MYLYQQIRNHIPQLPVMYRRLMRLDEPKSGSSLRMNRSRLIDRMLKLYMLAMWIHKRLNVQWWPMCIHRRHDDLHVLFTRDCFERDPLRMMELGVDGTFKRRLKPDATPNVPLASPDPERKKCRRHDDLHVLLSHDLHSNIINHYRSSRLACAHVQC
jgi:hypothetical protein